MDNDPKAILVRYFDVAHDAMLWKLDGLSEYDLRRPLTATGTNLLGLVKHLAWVEFGYFGHVFGRPADAGVEPGDGFNADMFATADESKDEIIALFHAAWAHAKETIDALDLDHEGYVPWWGEEGNPVTLHRILVHMATEHHRHLGQADILREQLDGAVGMREQATNMPPASAEQAQQYLDQLEAIADGFRDS